MKKKLMTCLAAAVEKNRDPWIESNLEALSEIEFGKKGTGECFDDYYFTTNAIFLKCGTCIYLYGTGYVWTKGNCS